MRENGKDIFGRKRRFGVMDTFAVLLEMPAKRRFATPLKVEGEKRRFIHEAEDFVVFSPPLYKCLWRHHFRDDTVGARGGDKPLPYEIG